MVLAPVVENWLNSVMPFVTDGGKPKLATSCDRVVVDCGKSAVSCVLRVPSSVPNCVNSEFSCVKNAERLSVVESAVEAAADWAVEAAWVAWPLSLVVAGASTNGVS